jgi:hypothetical protein
MGTVLVRLPVKVREEVIYNPFPAATAAAWADVRVAYIPLFTIPANPGHKLPNCIFLFIGTVKGFFTVTTMSVAEGAVSSVSVCNG